MKITRIKTVYKKEIMDLLRDKKTLIIMVLIPLLLYPLIMMGSLLFSSAIASSLKTNEYTIALCDDNAYTADGRYDRESFTKLLLNKEDEVESNLVIQEASATECDTLMEEGELDAYVVVEGKAEKNTFTIHYYSSNTSSSTAADIIESKLELYSDGITQELLTELGMKPESVLEPVATEFEDKSANEEKVGNILGMILPFLMVTSILMGAFYPAVDTTAGEKERGTLETLLTLPLRNDEIIMGKFFAVATISVASAILNLISVMLMSLFFYANMQSADTPQLSINFVSFIPAMLIVLLCVVAFAFFMSAVTMCVTTFAKSFKEANNYETPLLLVVMFASFVSFVPDLEFNVLLASIPVVNICMLLTNILVFKYELTLIVIVLVTNIAYAALTIMLLVKLFDSEDLLFGEGGSSLQLFTARGELKKGGVPNLSDAVLVMAMGMLLLLYVGSTLQSKLVLPGLFLTQLMIVGLPLFVAWYTKKDFKETFNLRKPKLSGVLAAILMEMGGYMIVIVLSSVLTQLFPQDMSQVNADFEAIFGGMTFVPALLLIALTPAICEEMFFRGYILSASKKKLKMTSALILGAMLFGIYHLSFVKLFTTGLLGLVFCYIVYRTGSIFLTMLLHFLNNSISVIATYYPEQTRKLVPVLFKESPSVTECTVLIVGGIILLSVGIFIIEKTSDKNKIL